MSDTVIQVENLSKVYRVGEWGTGTISHDLNRWWKTRILRQEDPYAKIGQTNDRTQKAQKGEFVWALKDINFEVKKGEVLGIIGKNGAGKSTLLKVLSRITAPTTGQALIKGRVASLLEVGTGFHPEMTGRENIYLNGTINGMTRPEITRKLDEIVDFAGVAKYLDTPVKRYSSGMTVRLGFAVAAFLEPEILIVDEVLAVGDAEFQKKAIGKIQDVSKGEGRTVLFVSHNMGSVKTICKNAILLNNGKISQFDEVNNVVNIYQTHNIEQKNQARKGRQKVLIEKVEIKNPNENVVKNEFLSGEAIEFIFYISNNKEMLNKEIQLGIQVYDQNNNFITALNNFTHGTKLIMNKNAKYGCLIKKLPLMNGYYLLNFGLIIDHVLEDYLEQHILLNVTSGDYYNSGTIKQDNRQGVYIEHNWNEEII